MYQIISQTQLNTKSLNIDLFPPQIQSQHITIHPQQMDQSLPQFNNFFHRQIIVLKQKIDKNKVIKKSKSIKNKRRKRLGWTQLQNKNYLSFIEQFKHTLQMKNKNTKFQIFKKMAQKVKTRNSSKCKSHHQKMLQRYGSIEEIIETLKKKTEEYDKLNDIQIDQIKNVQAPIIGFVQQMSEKLATMRKTQEESNMQSDQQNISVVSTVIISQKQVQDKQEESLQMENQEIDDFQQFDEKYLITKRWTNRKIVKNIIIHQQS